MPVRTCVGCRRRADAAELTRVVRTPEASLATGRTLPGRGAWVCTGSLACLELARSRRAFDRALRASVAPDAVERLAHHLGWKDDGGRTGLVPPTEGARG